MKKILAFLLSLLPWFANAYDFEVNGIYYDITFSQDKTCSVTFKDYSYNSYSGSVSIPSSVTYNSQTYSVTSIGYNAFSDCNGLTSIVIPSSVTWIGYDAFSDCSGLTSIVIPASVTSIYPNAFYCCSGLTSIKVEASNPVFDSRNNCNAIIEKETNTLLFGCKATVIPSSVTGIGSSAFSGCSGLTSIVIPASVTSIDIGKWCDGSPFFGCNLASIKVEEGNPVFDSRNNCNAIIETATNKLLCGCVTTVIPTSVTNIGDYAFFGCKKLRNIVLPSSVVEMGSCAFAECDNLQSFKSLGLTYIASRAFEDCISLETLYIPNVTGFGGNYWAPDDGGSYYPCQKALYLGQTPPSVDSYGSWVGEWVNFDYYFHNWNTHFPFVMCTLYVPKGCIETYRTYEQFKDVIVHDGYEYNCTLDSGINLKQSKSTIQKQMLMH